MPPSPEAGFAYHRKREELHGITVVVTGASGRTYVGRYHERGPDGVVLNDVGVHEGEAAEREPWLARVRKFGVPVTHRSLVLPDGEVVAIDRLSV